MGTVYIARTNNRIKAVYDKDCLPPNATKVAEFRTTANFRTKRDRSERFWHHYGTMRWLENLGFEICIDFGDYFYETGMQSPEIK